MCLSAFFGYNCRKAALFPSGARKMLATFLMVDLAEEDLRQSVPPSCRGTRMDKTRHGVDPALYRRSARSQDNNTFLLMAAIC